MRFARMWSAGLAVVVAALGGLAAPGVAEEKDKRTCFNKREIDAIRGLDDQHAFVKVGANRFYLLTTNDTCQGLKLARTIAVGDGTTRVCDDGSTLLSFTHPTVGSMRCRVEKIDSVPDMVAAQELIDSRRPPQ